MLAFASRISFETARRSAIAALVFRPCRYRPLPSPEGAPTRARASCTRPYPEPLALDMAGACASTLPSNGHRGALFMGLIFAFSYPRPPVYMVLVCMVLVTTVCPPSLTVTYFILSACAPARLKGVLVLAHPERQIYDATTEKSGCRAQVVFTRIAKVQRRKIAQPTRTVSGALSRISGGVER